VREVTKHDWGSIDKIFMDHPKAAFACPLFLTHRDYYSQFIERASLLDGASFSFRYEYEYSGYFDICIAHVDRLRRASWRFGNELETSLRARDEFGPCVCCGGRSSPCFQHPEYTEIADEVGFNDYGRATGPGSTLLIP
jgi:hypothetical protein